MANTKRNKRIDWVGLEQDYRTGRYSTNDLAAKYQCSKSTISKRSKQEEWTKDLAPHIRDTIHSKILMPENPTEPLTDEQIVDHAVSEGIEVLRQHKTRIKGLSQIVDSLTGELVKELSPPEVVPDPDEDAEPVEGPNIAKVSHVLQQTTTSLEKLIKLERQAFQLDDPSKSNVEKTLEELLAAAAEE